MERREFIKSTCAFCAAVAAAGVIGISLEGCKPSDLIYKASMANGVIAIPASEMMAKKILIVRNAELEYDILLVKESESAFHSLAMQCTHRQQPLVVTGNGLVCNEHGSRFDLDGNVTKDPATRPLQKFPVEISGENILIHLT